MIQNFSNWAEKNSSLYPDFTFTCFRWWRIWLSHIHSSDVTLTVASSGKLGTWRKHLWAVHPPFPAAKLLMKRWLTNPVLASLSSQFLHQLCCFLENMTKLLQMSLEARWGSQSRVVRWTSFIGRLVISPMKADTSPNFWKCLEHECWATSSGCYYPW